MVLKSKKKSISVLVTASGAMGAISIIYCLKKNFEKRKIKIICTDIYDQPVIRHFADSFYQLPKGNSKNYIQALMSVCKEENVNVVLPCSSFEVFAISRNYELLKSKNIFSPISQYNFLKKMIYKHKIYQILETRVPIPEYFVVENRKEFLQAISKLGFPKKKICFKPSYYLSSEGMRGFRILSDKTTLVNLILKNKPNSQEIDFETSLRFFEKNKTKFLVMEFLPGDHYSVYGLANNGDLVACVVLHYKEVKDGNGIVIVPEKNKELEKYCKIISKQFNLNGNFDVEFRNGKDGKPKLIEINPRVATGIGTILPGGLNLPYLAVKMALEEKLPKKKFRYKFTVMKYWSQLSVKN